MSYCIAEKLIFTKVALCVKDLGLEQLLMIVCFINGSYISLLHANIALTESMGKQRSQCP